MQSPLLTFLRRLEAQNIWRVTYNALPQQQYSSTPVQDQAEGGGRAWGVGGYCAQSVWCV